MLREELNLTTLSVVFCKLAALPSSVVPHEQTNTPTEALVDALYICRLIVATLLYVTLCFSCNKIPKVTFHWKEG
jgi:hypothetical protein